MSDEQDTFLLEQDTPPFDDAARVRQLLDSVADLLSQKPTDDLFERAWKNLDAAHDLAGETAEISQWRQKLSTLEREYRAYQKYEEARNACETLWAQEQTVLKQNASPDKVLRDIFEKAKQIAQQAADAFPESFLLDGLKNDSSFRFDAARQRYQIKSTADATRDYKETYNTLNELLLAGKGDEVIPWLDEDGKSVPSITVREALLEITKVAANYAHSKVQEYEKNAREALEQRHSPGEAREWVEKGAALWELPKEDGDRLQKYREEKIEPELARLEKAQALLKQADEQEEPALAWGKVQEAIDAYPWVPGVGQARRSIAGRILNQVTRILSVADDLCQAFVSLSDLDKVQARLDEEEVLFKIIRAFLQESEDEALQEKARQAEEQAAEISRQMAAARKFMQDVQTRLNETNNLFINQPDKAYPELQAFLRTYEKQEYRRYGDLRKRFPDLESLEAKISAHQNFETTLQTLEHEFALEDWESVIQVERKAREIYREEKDVDRRERLNRFLKKVQVRKDFLEAKRALDEKKDAELAIQYLQKVSRASGHPDQPTAEALLKKLQSDKENEEKVSLALKKAEAWLTTQPADAYQTLKAVENLPTRQRENWERLLAQSRQRWEEWLLARLEKAMEPENVDAQAIRSLAEQIQKLPQPVLAESQNRARQALGVAWALEAKVHAQAHRWQSAWDAWQEARKYSPSVAEYEQGWRQAKVQLARLALEKAKDDKQEVEELLRELSQGELAEDPGVFELRAEHYYLLSQDVSLESERRLDLLYQAESALNAALAVSVSAPIEKSRLMDLKKKIQADEELLKTLNELETRMVPESSLSQLLEVKQEVARMQAKPEISLSARDSLDKWWKNLVSRTVRALETLDDGIVGDSQVWDKFNIRSKIYLLDPGNSHAQELVRAIPNQTKLVLADIRTALGDRDALDVAGKKNDVLGILNAQKDRMDGLRLQTQTLKEMVGRVSSALVNADNLQKELTDALVEMETWQRDYDDFRRSILRMRAFLSQGRQDNRWSDYDREHSKIVNSGWGAHRVVKILDEERQAISAKRQQLVSLSEQIVQFAQEDKGLRLAEALNLLDTLVNDSTRGDPEDEYYLQAELKIIDPVTKKEISSAWEVRKWLEERQKQTKQVQEWAANCGLWENLFQAFPLLKGQKVQPARITPWREIKPKILEFVDRGRFTDALSALNFVQDGPNDISSIEKIAFLKPYQGSLSLSKALERLNQPPLTMQAALTRFVVEALQMAEKYGNDEIQPVLREIHQMREQIIRKQREWQAAEQELEQALAELKLVKERWNPIGKAAALSAAQRRVQSAILECRQIAPEHPALFNIEAIF